MDEHLSYELSLLNIDYSNSNLAMQDLLNLVKQYKEQMDHVHMQLSQLDGEYSKLQQTHLYLQSEHHQIQSHYSQLQMQHNKTTAEQSTLQHALQSAKKSELSVRQDMQFLKTRTASDTKRKDIEIGKVKDMAIKTLKMTVKKSFELHLNKDYGRYLDQKPIYNVPDAYQEYIDMLNDRNSYLKEELSYYKSLFNGVLYELPSEYESKDPQVVIQELLKRVNHPQDPQMESSTINEIIARQNRLLDLATSAEFEQHYSIQTAPLDTMNALLHDTTSVNKEWDSIEKEKKYLKSLKEQLALERMEVRNMIRQEEKNRVQSMINATHTPLQTPNKSRKVKSQVMDYSTPINNKRSIPFDMIKNSSVYKESGTIGTPDDHSKY